MGFKVFIVDMPRLWSLWVAFSKGTMYVAVSKLCSWYDHITEYERKFSVHVAT